MLNFKPLGRRVVVKRVPKETGGLILSEELQWEGNADTGIITAIGQLKWKDRKLGLAIGRTIFYVRYSPITIKEEDCYFVDVDQILGIK